MEGGLQDPRQQGKEGAAWGLESSKFINSRAKQEKGQAWHLGALRTGNHTCFLREEAARDCPNLLAPDFSRAYLESVHFSLLETYDLPYEG